MCEAFFELFKDEIAAKIAAAEDLIRKETEKRIRAETEERMKVLERENAELKKRLAN